MTFCVEEELAHYDPRWRLSCQEGGEWPHPNHYHFNEAVVASHFLLRGYRVLRGYSATWAEPDDSLSGLWTRLLHAVVGPEVRNFLVTELAAKTAGGSGEPDLFVFREEYPNDPKIRYLDSRRWFFVEVKGPGDKVGDNQRAFWRALAERPDLGLGPERIRLFKTAERGKSRQLKSLEY